MVSVLSLANLHATLGATPIPSPEASGMASDPVTSSVTAQMIGGGARDRLDSLTDPAQAGHQGKRRESIQLAVQPNGRGAESARRCTMVKSGLPTFASRASPRSLSRRTVSGHAHPSPSVDWRPKCAHIAIGEVRTRISL